MMSPSLPGGVEQITELNEMNCFIALSPQSFKTDQDCEMVKHIPLDRLLLHIQGPGKIDKTFSGYQYLKEKTIGYYEATSMR
jgi:TatD DNase family protein